MPELNNVTINKVYETQKDDWTRWDIYLKGYKDLGKLGFFKPKEGDYIVPEEGMILSKIVYTKEGKYANVQSMVLHEEQPAPQPKRSGRDDSISMYISYAKDLMCSYMVHGNLEGATIDEIADKVAHIGIKLYDRANREPAGGHKKENAGVSMPETDLEDGPPDDQFPPSDVYGE